MTEKERPSRPRNANGWKKAPRRGRVFVEEGRGEIARHRYLPVFEPYADPNDVCILSDIPTNQSRTCRSGSGRFRSNPDADSPPRRTRIRPKDVAIRPDYPTERSPITDGWPDRCEQQRTIGLGCRTFVAKIPFHRRGAAQCNATRSRSYVIL